MDLKARLSCSPMLAALTAMGAAWPAWAQEELPVQTGNREPEAMRDVGIDEMLGAQLPLDLAFKDGEGNPVRFGDLLDGERPLVLTFNYADCPNLCTTQLDGFVGTLNGMDRWRVGEQFQVVTLSLDPEESDELNSAFRERTLGAYDTAAKVREGWHFWRGSEDDVRRVADTVGFRYNAVPGGQFAHTAALVLLDPGARVARYLYGVTYDPTVLRLSLAETAAGKYVSTLDALILKCFLYDAAAGSYTASAWAITKGILIFLAMLLFGLIGWMLVLERRRKRILAT